MAGLAGEIGKRSPFVLPAQEAYVSLVRTLSLLSEPIDRVLKEHKLSEPLYNILRILRGHALEAGEDFCGLATQRIGEHMLSREPDMTRLIDRLERAGLVERRRSNEDRRVVLVAPTEAGLDLAERLTPEIDAVHREQFTGLSAEEVTELIGLLDRIRAGLRGSE
ncbi:MAG: MarR family transcriptional regulator [Planctomycetota bacterium]